jgi:hypothetical protein
LAVRWPAAGGGDYRPYGKGNVAWFVLAALLAIVVLAQISRWYAAQHRMNKGKPKAASSIRCRAIRSFWRLAFC